MIKPEGGMHSEAVVVSDKLDLDEDAEPGRVETIWRGLNGVGQGPCKSRAVFGTRKRFYRGG